MIDSIRVAKLKSMLEERILVVDGAMGTSIQSLDLSATDFGGIEYEGCNEYLNLTRPDIIENIHRRYIEAGADIIETNSFGSTPLVLGEYGLEEKAYEISKAAATLAKDAKDKWGYPDSQVFVAGSMGPTTKALSLTGGITWDQLFDNYYVQAHGLIDGGADLLLVETSQDILNVKAALVAIDELGEKLDVEIPVAVQCTIETMGTMLCGQDIEAFYSSIAHVDLLWIGMNCATGPEFMRDHLRTLSGISRFPVAVIPNAGLPDEDGHYSEVPESLSATLQDFCHEGWVNIVGGCCGTGPDHIRQLADAVSGVQARRKIIRHETVVSGLESFVIDDDTRPVLVGERTNVLGSRRFKRLVADSKWEEMAEIGREQVRGGANVVDVCLQDPDRDEMSDMENFLKELTKRIKVSIMLDSTDATVIKEALKLTPGKSIINSVNLEDGEERFKEVVPLAKKFGAALVVGCIDEDKEQAQAITRDRKLQVAQRSFDILTKKYGIPPEDIIFDPLVFPIATGDVNYIGSGVETIEGIRLIKKSLPAAKVILGISNVSFGLPTAGREVLNSVFLYHCVQAGLDMAIVNPALLQRYASIPQNERDLAENLIWGGVDDPISAFANHFRDRKPEKTKEERLSLPLDQRITNCVIEGTKEGLISDLDEALKYNTPLDIINGPLMAGMDEVGRLFGANELIVAEVLSSAESMKAAVNYLESYMDKGESISKGTVVLATVKGDVHDIGKNLVDIILTNNGYKIINLGIKVAPQALISAAQEYKPDIIGLSGLLVKSAQMMRETAKDLKNAAINIPILVGGAALSNKFTRLRISPEYDGPVVYAGDAMEGLSLANQIRDAEQLDSLVARLEEETMSLLASEGSQLLPKKRSLVSGARPAFVKTMRKPPLPPDLTIHILKDYDMAEIFDYINPVMLYNRHLGYRGRFLEDLELGRQGAIHLRSRVRAIEELMIGRQDIGATGVYKFFRVSSDADDVLVWSTDGKTAIDRFQFGRQTAGEGLCLADYIVEDESSASDYMACFVTTVGLGIRDLSRIWIDDGRYLDAHILQALAIEGAEAFAEVLHQRLRAMWGISDDKSISKQDLFKANYVGRRFSFGYPACPRLEDQAKLWDLLDPERYAGVLLTDEFMMDPEASVSALVFHHDQAKYFSLSTEDVENLESRMNFT